MFSELLRIPNEWNGVPIFGVGVLLAIWAIAAAVTIAGLVRRTGWGAETWSALPMLLLLGAGILLLPRVFPEGLPVRGYGVMLLAGIVSGVGLAMVRGQKGGLDSETVLSLALWLVVCGVVGARLFFVVEYWDEKFAGRSVADTLREIVNVPQGGLVIYGGFLGAATAFIVFVRKHKLPLLAMADLAAPSMMIGLAFGRIGCLLNGCCYGGQTDWPWHVSFPPDSPPYADQAARGELLGFRLEARDGQPVVVGRVDAGSPAAAAGLQVGDVVQAINGLPVASLAEAKHRTLAIFGAARPVALRLTDGTVRNVAPIERPPRSRPIHPTQIYSAIDAALLFWLLWAYYPFRTRDGQCIALLLTIHPITRFLLEIIRTDEPAVFGTGLSISQNISIVLLMVAAGLWWYIARQPRGVVWPLVAPGASVKSAAASARANASRSAAAGKDSKSAGSRTPGRK